MKGFHLAFLATNPQKANQTRHMAIWPFLFLGETQEKATKPNTHTHNKQNNIYTHIENHVSSWGVKTNHHIPIQLFGRGAGSAAATSTSWDQIRVPRTMRLVECSRITLDTWKSRGWKPWMRIFSGGREVVLMIRERRTRNGHQIRRFMSKRN